MKQIEKADEATLKWVLMELVQAGHIAAALEFMAPRSHAAWILKGEMIVSEWESVEYPCGGHGDNIRYSTGKNPAEFEFNAEAWEILYSWLPDQTRDWIIEVFAEEGP